MTAAMDRLRRHMAANVVVTFDNFGTPDAPVVAETANFRKLIRALGVRRHEYDYINNDRTHWVSLTVHRSRRFVALTPHAECVFRLARP